ncbi:MAG: hypothetical protein RL207_1309 [Bacteroidota bacterium]|jgi:hypothetical protein
MNRLIKENGVVLGFLVFWGFINFICLMMAKENAYYAKENFFPFSELKLKYAYDITEFLIYGVSPFVVFLIIKLIQNEKK